MAEANTIGRRTRRVVAWLAAAIVVLIAALVVLLLTFDWNRARPWVDRTVSDAIGRPFAINGDLAVGWRRPAGETGWRAWVPWPRFSAQQVTIGNPAWAKQPDFVTLDEIDFEVAVLPLLAHAIVIPTIRLVNPSVDLERLADGRDNWTFAMPASGSPSTWRVDLHDIVFAKGEIALADAQTKTDAHVTVDTLGQPIPLGEVLKRQERAAHEASARMIGRQGADRFAAQANALAASEAAAAARAASAAASVAASAAVAGSGSASMSAASAVLAQGGRGASVSASGSASAAARAAAASASAAALSAAAGAAPVAPSGVAPTPASASTASAPVAAPLYAIGWTLKGRYRGTPVSGSGKLGGVLALQNPHRPFPLQADVRAGDLRVAFVGTLTDPLHLAAIDMRLWLQGSSMAHLYALTGVTLPETPPYATEGHLIGHFKRGASVFRYEDFTGRVGGSDLNGTLTYTQREPRPLLQGELVSNLLRFADLAPVIGADSHASKARRGDTVRQPAGKVLPVEQFHTDRWKAIDADVRFTGRRLIKDPALPITHLDTHIVLKDGVLSLEPLSFGVAGGTLSTDIRLDGATTPLRARISASARHLKLKQLFPTAKTMQSALGEINGDAALSATGNSPAALAATSNGELKALVTQGTISRLLMEAAGLNVANVVYEKLFGSSDVKINCAAADFTVNNGIVDPRVFALDTSDAVIDIDGKVDLRDETLDLGIHPHTKGLRVFSLRSPLYVKGTFADPHVGVDATALALRGGAMIGLGLINPFAALIPLIAPSNNQPLPCGALLAKERMRPTAPPPGQARRHK
jgi:uncharacterized protein involved in outer membrane biogenesis